MALPKPIENVSTRTPRQRRRQIMPELMNENQHAEDDDERSGAANENRE